MPKQAAGLWAFVLTLAQDEQLNLLAHCASLTLDAILRPHSIDIDGIRQSADEMTER